jgi:hypothetical protein
MLGALSVVSRETSAGGADKPAPHGQERTAGKAGSRRGESADGRGRDGKSCLMLEARSAHTLGGARCAVRLNGRGAASFARLGGA